METIIDERVKITRVGKGFSEERDDELAPEEPLQIQIQYSTTTGRIRKNIAVTMRTPGHDPELAAGFLFTEGIINGKDEVDGIRQPNGEDNTVTVILKENSKPKLQTAGRNFYTTSSCGICGKTSIDTIAAISVYANLEDAIKIPAAMFFELPGLARKQQVAFENTGGLHASALFNLNGSFVMLREDVGRHNALDKLIGTALLDDRLPLSDSVLLLSGRASFELIQKATMSGIKVVAAIGAPSGLAVDLAKANDITLVGFLRNDHFNIYSGHKRIIA